MKTAFTFVLSILLTEPLLHGQLPAAMMARLEEADRQVTRLAPTDFPDLPENLVRELERRGCTIPQERRTESRENVIKGNFSKPGQVDWAVLCSSHHTSAILVFWGGSEKNPSELARRADAAFLQDIGNDEIGFSRVITTIGRKQVLQYYAAFGGPKPPSIVHQGIEDAFAGKASVLHYFDRGKWLELTGAD